MASGDAVWQHGAMSLIEHYRAMARYNLWMNERLYAACAKLSEVDRRRDVGGFFGSVHGALNHILLADCAWLIRLTRDDQYRARSADGQVIQIKSLDQILYEDFADLSANRSSLDQKICTWAEALSEAATSATLEYKDSRGTPYSHPAWYAMSHMFNHQTHHRGQVTALLFQLGQDPGITDLAVMLRA